MLPHLISALIAASGLATTSCSVKPGPLPVGEVALEPAAVAKTRSQIHSALNQLQNSVAMMGRVQGVIQRGLAERQVKVSGDAAPASLLASSDADALSFDHDHAERFSYQLNNSASFGLTTKSGGRIKVLLSGAVADSKLAITDAKLDITYEQAGGSQTFHILYEKKHVDGHGEDTTEWAIDFHQLSDLYRHMGGEDEGVASLSGLLSVRLSASEAHVTAQDFTLKDGDISVVFTAVELNLVEPKNGQRSADVGQSIKLAGRVERGGGQLGAFSLSQASGEKPSAFSVSIDVK